MSVLGVAVTSVVFLVPGLVLFLLGFLNRKSDTHERVRVLAQVVEYSNFTRPHRVTFDYPLPDGQWNRQTKMATYISDPTGALRRPMSLVRPGHQFYVYVNPANPFDVTLGFANPARVFPILGMLIGAAFTGMYLLFLAVVYLW